MQTQATMVRQDHYQEVLNSYISTTGEDGLTVAYDMGRNDLRTGVGILDLAETHQQALRKILLAAENTPETQQSINTAAGCFFREALSPFEVARLSTRDSTDALIKLYDVFEKEAKRIAHRLHDESEQMLAVVYLELAEIAKASPPDTSERIHGVFDLLNEICGQLRTLSHELRPIVLDQMGLMPALRLLINGVQKRSNLLIDLSGDTEGRLDPAIETVIYRMVQEALTNVCRHANATHTDVHIWRDDAAIYCSVSDNGNGFKQSKNDNNDCSGLGLIGIKERAKALGGVCELSTRFRFGTTLQVTIPL